VFEVPAFYGERLQKYQGTVLTNVKIGKNIWNIISGNKKVSTGLSN
jgi:hypothetical protein